MEKKRKKIIIDVPLIIGLLMFCLLLCFAGLDINKRQEIYEKSHSKYAATYIYDNCGKYKGYIDEDNIMRDIHGKCIGTVAKKRREKID